MLMIYYDLFVFVCLLFLSCLCIVFAVISWTDIMYNIVHVLFSPMTTRCQQAQKRSFIFQIELKHASRALTATVEGLVSFTTVD